MSKILLLDGQNLFHRARAGFGEGDHSVTYNFFRGFRALVEQFDPNHIYFGLEGKPKKRYELLGDYKANRKVDPNSEKAKELELFFRQTHECIELLKSSFPVSVVRHPDYECDDVLATIASSFNNGEASVTIISSDTDYIQLLTNDNIKLYNPVKKSYVEWDRNIDYVTYKSLKGDSSDNIPGIFGIGDKKAKDLAGNSAKLADLLVDQEKYSIFNRNKTLITFENVLMNEINFTSPQRNWDLVKQSFLDWKFDSITNDKSWNKFVNTFKKL